MTTIDLREQLQSTLGTAYTVESELGGGGMSRVFVATEIALGRRVVVKVLPPDLIAHASVERFRREILFAARLHHAHIVPLLTAGEAGGLLYYTMPLVQGESLRARLTRAGELPVSDATAILRDVATALAYAHREGVVHRDIKPENVLLTEHDALVLDFGVSKAVSAAVSSVSGVTSLGLAIGTPAYMSPEQAAGDPHVDHRADIYAFGLVAYEMLTGAGPFAGRSEQALLAAHMVEAPEPLARRRPGVPDALAVLVTRCLEKRPADRPQSADELVRALDALATSGVTSGSTSADALAARAVTPALAPRRARGRLKRRVAIAAAATAAIAGVVTATIMLRSRPSVPVDRTAIAVLPFRVTGADQSLQALREGMPDLVSAELTGRIHAMDARTVLSAWRRAGGGPTSDLARPATLTLARGLGAGAVLEGDIVGTRDALVLNGTLVTLPDGTERRATVRGAPDKLATLVDSLVNKLLVFSAGESDDRVSSLAGVPVDALQSYLLGRALDRSSRWTEASEAYARATASDSTFALAGLRLWVTASNWSNDPRGPTGRRIAARYADRLGPRDRLVLGPTTELDRPRSCRETLGWWEAGVAAAPDMPDLWYLIGERLTHCGFAMGVANAIPRALNSFNRALALDSTYAAAYEHLPILYALVGDTARSNRSLAILQRDSTREGLAVYELFLPSTRPDTRPVVERLKRSSPLVAGNAVVAAIQFGTRLDEAEELLRSLQESAVTSADRERVAVLTRTVAFNRGQPARARAAMLAGGSAPDPALTLLAATFWDGDTAAARSARPAALASLGDAPRDSAARERWTSTLFALAAFDLARGDTSTARRAVAALRSTPTPAAEPWRANRARRLALLLDAQLAQATRRGDAGTVLAAADSMLRDAPGGLYVETVGNLMAASLWERGGDVARAYAAVQRVRIGTNEPLFHSTYLREQGRLGALAGDREGAIKAYRRYLALRSVAEPSVAAQVVVARRDLARLERVTK